MTDANALSDTVTPTGAPAAPAASASTPLPAADAAPISPASEPVSATPEVAVMPVEKTALGSDPVITKDETPAPEVKTEAVEPTKEEGSQSAELAPMPSYEAFKFPEGSALDDAKLNEFTKDLGDFQLKTKAEQAAVQEFGQKLVDKYVAEMQSVGDRLNEHYAKTWEKTKSDWKETFEKDPEIGGNRKDTTINGIVNAISQYGGKPEQQAEFRQFVDQTGVGNHPALIRTFHNLVSEINRLKTTYESESGVKPLPGTKPQPEATSKVQRRYGKSL